MIFRQWEKVLDGTKTQTRRLVGKYDYLHSNKVMTKFDAYSPDRLKYKIGHTYAIQPKRGRRAVGRIRITRIRRERLQDISKEDRAAEGVKRASFRTLWNKIHKKPPHRWEGNPEVWVLSFVLVEAQNGTHN